MTAMAEKKSESMGEKATAGLKSAGEAIRMLRAADAAHYFQTHAAVGRLIAGRIVQHGLRQGLRLGPLHVRRKVVAQLQIVTGHQRTRQALLPAVILIVTDIAQRAREIAEMEAQIREAAALLDAGVKRARPARAPKPEAEVPPELAEALAKDDAASMAFTAFPPGCRREYCEWIAEAKRPETKAKRVEEAVSWIREGKRRNWKYENC